MRPAGTNDAGWVAVAPRVDGAGRKC
jgi:hypothetical protein